MFSPEPCMMMFGGPDYTSVQKSVNAYRKVWAETVGNQQAAR